MSYVQRFGPFNYKNEIGFRFWAPDANAVQLILNDNAPLPMQRNEGGWHETTASYAKAGDRYRFLLDDGMAVPDPASLFQPQGPEGPSEIVDHGAFAWTDDAWRGRSWEEAVIYKLHVGCFSSTGDYRGVEEKLNYLADLGITAIEVMPLAEFAGARGWGYDGVLPYAPKSAYGRPEELKRLVDAAHARGLMVFLDVVYNHFGPSGNYLPHYAKAFFTEKHKTPWGAAINYEGSRDVRDFFIGNALYWLREYHFDGLRFDAVHAIEDSSAKHILNELAQTVRAALPDRHIHLMLENEKNEARYLAAGADKADGGYNAQWNDDIHHAFHVLLTGETQGYYADYKDRPIERLGRALSEGFIYQGEPSRNRKGEKRGEPSAHLPPQAFINFLQNHDQVGNRAMGERIGHLAPHEKLTLASAILLLSPSIPLLFMGEEWDARTPFFYFCDFKGELAEAVREGRRKEFSGFAEFSSEALRRKIPDPNDEKTFLASKLKWNEANGNVMLAFTRRMLELRQGHIVPLMKTGFVKSEFRTLEDRGLAVSWHFEGGTLQLFANFSDEPLSFVLPSKSEHLWGTLNDPLPAWKCSWFVGKS